MSNQGGEQRENVELITHDPSNGSDFTSTQKSAVSGSVEDLILFKKIQKIFEDGLREEFIKIPDEQKIIVGGKGDELAREMIARCSDAEQGFHPRKIHDAIKDGLERWFGHFVLAADFAQSQIKEKARQIAELFDFSHSKTNQPIISLKNIDVKYNFGRPSEYHAIKDVSLDIYEGELVIFLGPSGCGKSTLTNVIAGLEKPTSGTIRVNGEDITKYNHDEMAVYHADKIGFVFQAYNLIESLSVEDNVILPQMFQDKSRKERREAAQKLLDRFGILPHAAKSPVMLSGGQQQRVGIARSLINNPSIILADEPTGNLDSASTELAIKIFVEMNKKEKKTILMVTHNPDFTVIANRIIHMKDGMIIKEEINNDIRPDEIKTQRLKERGAEGSIPDDLKQLLRSYGAMTLSQLNSMWIPLKAKMITEEVLIKYSHEQMTLIQDAVRRRLMGLITRKEVFDIMDLPLEEGGAGLDKRTAGVILEKIEEILKEAEEIKIYDKINEDDLSHGQEIITNIRKELLSNYTGQIIQGNIDGLEKCIRQRLKNEIDKSRFINVVSLPIWEGGAGFKRSTARIFAKELELLMLIKFGEEHSK